jgi:hypothetical protein
MASENPGPASLRLAPRYSNSFSREELEIMAVALERAEQFANLPGGLVGADYEALGQVVQSALRGGDITGLVRSRNVQSALIKLEGLRRWSRADLTVPTCNPVAQTMVVERVSKMLARARQQDVIQVAAAQEKSACG